MRLVALALVVLTVGLGACRRGSSRFEGHWKGSAVEGVPPEAQAGALAFAREMELQVSGDTITVVTPQDRQSGRYTVDREDKTTLVLYTDKDGKGDKQTFTFVGDKIVKWTVFDGKTATITFVKDERDAQATPSKS